jgi:transcriptional regulator with AAA-type ATPase domain
MASENIFVTWHYTTHGTAFLKHILSAFNQKYKADEYIADKEINLDSLNQEKLAVQFDFPQKVNKGFLFDKVYYVTTDQTHFDHLSTRRFKYRENVLKDAEIKKLGLLKIWEKIIAKEKHIRNENPNLLFRRSLEEELAFVKENFDSKLYQSFEKEFWREIHHYNIKDQIKWFTEKSNAKDFYAERFEEVPISGIENLRDVASIVQNLVLSIDHLKKKHPQANWYFCVSLGSNETQTAWYILSEAQRLPINTHFIQSYDKKTTSDKTRFFDFFIKETPPRQISILKEQLSLKIAESNKSEARQFAQQKLKIYTKMGFSILLLGERGTGKSRLAETATTKGNSFVPANCASFADDTMAESELFGYVKGAFTGADTDKLGLIAEANGGILFLDEIHLLSKKVQGKLMTAFQTDENNKLTIRRLGSNLKEKVECQLILASNKSISELQDILLPDFYDRIVQLVINIPPLRESTKDIYHDWKIVWNNLNIGVPPTYNSSFKEWLSKQPLNGNFRDLQKIAIYYNAYQQFNATIRENIPQKNAFDYAKSEFQKYHGKSVQTNPLDLKIGLKQLITDYKKYLAIKAIEHFGSAKKAEDYYKKNGDGTTERSLYKWKNGK